MDEKYEDQSPRKRRAINLIKKVRPSQREIDAATQHSNDIATGHKESVGEYCGYQYRPVRYE